MKLEEKGNKPEAKCKHYDLCYMYDNNVLLKKIEKAMCGRGKKVDIKYVPKIPNPTHGGQRFREGYFKPTCDAYTRFSNEGIESLEEQITETYRRNQELFDKLEEWVELKAIERFNGEYIGDPRDLTDIIGECVRKGKKAILYGESGCGKTFTLLKLYNDILQQKESLNKNLLNKTPIYIDLSKINMARENLDTIFNRKIKEARLTNKEERAIFLLDNLNLVGDRGEREHVIMEINYYSCEKEARFAIAKQTLEDLDEKSILVKYENEPFYTYEIQPFKREDVIKYLTKHKDKFNSKKEAEAFYESLPKILEEIYHLPAILNILISRDKKEESVGIIDNPGELLGEYEEFLCGSRKNTRVEISEPYRDRVAFIAYNMCKKNEENIGFEEFNKYIAEYHGFTPHDGNTYDAVTDIFHIMKQVEPFHFEFTHKIIREYFAATYMKDKRMNPDEIVNEVYKGSKRNDNLANAVKLLVGIEKPEVSKSIIKKFAEKDAHFASGLYKLSSIENQQHK